MDSLGCYRHYGRLLDNHHCGVRCAGSGRLPALGRIDVVQACGDSLAVGTATVPEGTTHHGTELGDYRSVVVGDRDIGVVHQVGDLDHAGEVGLHGIGEGVNVVKRHTKPNNANPDGGIINKELPISVSNVKLVDDKKKKSAKKNVKGAKK